MTLEFDVKIPVWSERSVRVYNVSTGSHICETVYIFYTFSFTDMQYVLGIERAMDIYSAVENAIRQNNKIKALLDAGKTVYVLDGSGVEYKIRYAGKEPMR